MSYEHSIIILKTSHCSRTNIISSCIEIEKTTANSFAKSAIDSTSKIYCPSQSDFATYIDIRHMISVHSPPLLISRFGVPRVRLKDLIGCEHGIGDQPDKIRIYTAPSFPWSHGNLKHIHIRAWTSLALRSVDMTFLLH